MPLYDRTCRSCHYMDEVLEPISSTESISCPKCGKSWDRVISAPSRPRDSDFSDIH